MSSIYVVVNTTRQIWLGGGHPVMPGEEPHTYDNLADAAETIAELNIEHGHTPETAVVYRLVPVPLEQVTPHYDAALAEIEEDITD